MILKLMDYDDKEKEFDIGELDTIGKIDVEVISGDEIATVYYKDYTVRKFDSSDCRHMNFYDGEYELYHCEKTDNALNDPKWQNRTDSYQYFDNMFV